jgi:transcriptional regulator with XRE-family HTH domain
MTQAQRIEFLKNARDALGSLARVDERPLTQEVFAVRCGWTGSMQYKYESGVSEIGDHVVDRVRAILIEAGIDPASLSLLRRPTAP